MTFDLLDGDDGNAPAVVSGGVLRIDPSGRMPDAPENIHRLWKQAETTFFATNMYMDAWLAQAYLDWDRRRLSDWFKKTRESQQEYQRLWDQEMNASRRRSTTPPTEASIDIPPYFESSPPYSGAADFDFARELGDPMNLLDDFVGRRLIGAGSGICREWVMSLK